MVQVQQAPPPVLNLRVFSSGPPGVCGEAERAGQELFLKGLTWILSRWSAGCLWGILWAGHRFRQPLPISYLGELLLIL